MPRISIHWHLHGLMYLFLYFPNSFKRWAPAQCPVAVQENEEVPVLEAWLQTALGQRSRGVGVPFCRWEAKGLWCIWGVRERCRAGNQPPVPEIINPALLSWDYLLHAVNIKNIDDSELYSYIASVSNGWWRSSETEHLLKCKILLPDSPLCFMVWQIYYGDNIQGPHLTEFKSRRTYPGQVFFSSLLMAANILHMWVTVTACTLCLLRYNGANAPVQHGKCFMKRVSNGLAKTLRDCLLCTQMQDIISWFPVIPLAL